MSTLRANLPPCCHRNAAITTGKTRTMRVLALAGAAAAPPLLRHSTSAVGQLAAASRAFAAVLDTHHAMLELAVDQLKLEPVHSNVAPDGTFSCAAQDGSGAGAAVLAYHGAGVQWLSSSTLADPQKGFGTCRLLGFVLASCRDAACRDSDVPHLAVEQTLLDDKLQGIITLWPRQSNSNDLDYLHRYFSSVPAGSGLRCYNDIQNEAYEASERQGWRHYQPRAAEVKPLLAASIAYTCPAEDDNLRLFRGWAMELAALWAAFMQQGGCPAKDPAALHRFDSRYLSCITTDPGNQLAIRLFGELATDKLLKMATGHPAVAS